MAKAFAFEDVNGNGLFDAGTSTWTDAFAMRDDQVTIFSTPHSIVIPAGVVIHGAREGGVT
jgi:hypothetical protein